MTTDRCRELLHNGFTYPQIERIMADEARELRKEYIKTHPELRKVT